MAASIVHQIVKILIQRIIDKWASTYDLIQNSDKRFWRGYFFGQLVFFFALIVILELIFK